MSLEEVGPEIAKLPADSTPIRSDWSPPSGEWTNRIDRRIAELQPSGWD
jgi:MerR family transcriptional regulator, redox-sensitive transcriptional activator SoxR